MRDSRRIKFLNMSLCVTVDSTNEQDMDGTATPPLPTLAAILACREASSGIMEHEKTILVMKEHDYAKTPDMSQLAPLFRLLTGEMVSNDIKPRKAKPFRKGSELFDVKQALADARATLLTEDGGALSNHLNKMVSLQTTLIQQLQEQVFFKGLETATIRREKEQLEARLERMERRLSILQKRSKRKDEPELDSTDANSATIPTTPQPVNTPNQAKPEQLTRLARSESVTSRNSRSRSSSTEGVSRRNSRTSSTTNSLEVTHRAGKRGLEGSGVVSMSKKARSSSPVVLEEHLTTSDHYDGLGLSLSRLGLSPSGLGLSPSGSPPRLGLGMSGLSQLESLADDSSNKKSFVKVPSWRVDEVHPLVSTESVMVTEDTSDESFAKRHSKPENEEKRRKRWDAQRMRERLHHDQLLKRYMMKEGCAPQPEKKKDKVTSFLPKLDDIEEIEITDTLIVSAFGKPLPNIKPTAFRLAHFDPMAVKNTRGKLKSKVAQSSGPV